MKTLKILVLLVFTTVTFYSCSDSNPIENDSTTQKSIALRTVLNEFKTTNNLSGKTDPTNGFCFEFIYPLTFSFNNDTVVTVSSFDGLIDVLSNETPALYIEGIAFPFQIVAEGAVSTINNEEEFTALIESCGFDTFDDDLSNTFCFDIVFPIYVQLSDPVIAVNSLQELLNLVNEPNSNGEIQIIFPISVIYNNEIVVVNNIYEFYEMTNNCNQGGCVCTEQYDPVCVQTPNGIIEFGNMCFAECAGYTVNDLVACNGSTDCDISNLEVTIGNCNSDFSYPLTINFSFVNASSSTFIVRNSSGDVVGSYALSDLPITINNYVSNTNATDFITVELGANNSCSATQEWILPNCDCNCPTDINPVCVYDANGTLIQFDNSCLAACAGYTPITFVNCNQSVSNFANQLGICFTIAYPVFVQSGGALVTVNSDAQLLTYPNAITPIPVMNYPIVVTFLNPSATFTFASQAGFEEQISTHCN